MDKILNLENEQKHEHTCQDFLRDQLDYFVHLKISIYRLTEEETLPDSRYEETNKTLKLSEGIRIEMRPNIKLIQP